MTVRLAALFIGLTILGCALLASYQRKPFELRIDGPSARPAVWPTNAGGTLMPGAMICQPVLYPRHPPPSQIVRT